MIYTVILPVVRVLAHHVQAIEALGEGQTGCNTVVDAWSYYGLGWVGKHLSQTSSARDWLLAVAVHREVPRATAVGLGKGSLEGTLGTLDQILGFEVIPRWLG